MKVQLQNKLIPTKMLPDMSSHIFKDFIFFLFFFFFAMNSINCVVKIFRKYSLAERQTGRKCCQICQAIYLKTSCFLFFFFFCFFCDEFF